MAEDGSVRIGCELVTDKFDRQIKQLEKTIEKDEQKQVIIKAKLEVDKESLEKARALTDRLEESRGRWKTLQRKQEKGTITTAEQGTLTGFENKYGSVEKLNAQLEKAIENQMKLENKVHTTESQYKNITDHISESKDKIESIKMQKQVAETENMKKGFEKVGDSIQGAFKKAGKLVLGIFAIRSAYMTLRRASSDLANYDKEYASNLEYIRYVLTEAIAPVLKWIIQLASTLLNYIFQILNAWFGWNLGKTAKDFESMKKSSGGVADNMKEAEKSAQGFDELNVLQDNKVTDTSSGFTAPTIDLSGGQGEAPEWLKWIKDNGELILAILGGITAGIIALKLGLSGIQALGIGLAVAGIITLIQSLIGYINDPSWENFGGILEGIGLIVAGIGVVFGGLPAIIAGVITFIVGFIAKHWEEIKSWWNGVIDWFKKTGEWIHENCGDFLGGIWDTITDFVESVGKILGAVFETIKGVFDGIIQFFKGVFTGDWSQAWEGIKKIFQSVWDGICKIGETIFNFFKNLITRVWDAISGIVKRALNALFSLVEEILNLPIRAINGLIWVINLVPGVEIPEIPLIKLPRLKTGGIVNMPGKGTMIGGAVAGESGREGVIPLTDSQAMETLGESIGKYVTINATINNTMDGKLISRHIQKIQSQQAFAGNF